MQPFLCSACNSENTETRVQDDWEKTLIALATECRDCGYVQIAHGAYDHELFSALKDQL